MRLEDSRFRGRIRAKRLLSLLCMIGSRRAILLPTKNPDCIIRKIERDKRLAKVIVEPQGNGS